MIFFKVMKLTEDLGMPVIFLLSAAVGLFTISSDAVRLICGPNSKTYNLKFPMEVIRVGKVIIQPAWLLIFVLTAILLAILWFILNRTRLGLAWRATAGDREIALVCGVNTNNAMALYNNITPALGEVPSYKMLAIIVLGGLGNPLGTVIAGLIIGIAEVFLSVYTKIPIPKDAIAFVVLIIMLLVKPEGIMGRRNKV